MYGNKMKMASSRQPCMNFASALDNHCISCLSAITAGKLPSPNGTYKHLLLPQNAIKTFEKMTETLANVILLRWR
ncbi:hypothetical protein T4C_327, partial [Trichinella pseudospiralis]